MDNIGDLRTVLLADSAIATLIGTRMYPTILPQNTTYPAITYQQISGVREVILDGPVDLVPFRIQIDCWAQTALQRDALARAVRLKLNGLSADLGGSPSTGRICVAILDNERDLDEEEEAIFRKSLDFMIHANEDVTA